MFANVRGSITEQVPIHTCEGIGSFSPNILPIYQQKMGQCKVI